MSTFAPTLLRLPAVLDRTGLSRTAAYRLMRDGRFPRPVSLGGTNAKAWSASVVDDWIMQQIGGHR